MGLTPEFQRFIRDSLAKEEPLVSIEFPKDRTFISQVSDRDDRTTIIIRKMRTAAKGFAAEREDLKKENEGIITENQLARNNNTNFKNDLNDVISSPRSLKAGRNHPGNGALKRVLRSLGYNVSGGDNFDHTVHTAIEQLQDGNVVVDGVVGPETKKLIRTLGQERYRELERIRKTKYRANVEAITIKAGNFQKRYDRFRKKAPEYGSITKRPNLPPKPINNPSKIEQPLDYNGPD